MTIPIILCPETKKDLRVAEKLFKQFKTLTMFDPYISVERNWECWLTEDIVSMKAKLITRYIDSRKMYIMIRFSPGGIQASFSF